MSNNHESRFDDLFVAHHLAVYRYCLRRLGAADAEDASAEVFAVAWRRLSQIPSAERVWLLGVAQRVVRNQYRSRRRRANLRIRLQSAPSEPLLPDESDLVLLALDSLRPGDRELLRLFSWDRLTRAEIAEVLGIKENAVDQRLHRARSRLKASYESLNQKSFGAATKGAPS